MVGGGRVYGGSNMSVLLQNDGISCSSESLDSILLSNSSPFHGSGSMVNFADVNGVNFTKRSFFQVVDNDENGEEDLDEYLRQPEKKRRLTTDQVEYLEKSFEVENKLEPDRKIQLAKDLGLQPRQVAIWFQNRRARWKTKQLEKDYEILKASYNSLKTNYENLIKEKEKLKTEVLTLTDKQLQKQRERGNSDPVNPNSPSFVEPQNTISNSVSEEKPLEVSVVVCKQEISSTNSDIVDVDSPHYGHGVHSSLIIETANSSHVFEADQSETSQDEEDNFSQNLVAPFYSFPKLEDTDEPPANSCNYEFLAEDQPPPGWFWSY